jgi:EAL domain-containing protein (putative c-di-GMP-specific phosphodiesterase class I)
MNAKSLSPTDMLRAQLEFYAEDFGRITMAHQSLQKKYAMLQNALGAMRNPPQPAARSYPVDDAPRREAVQTLMQGLDETLPFPLLYHPQVQAGRGRVVAVEALLHFEHPVHGRIASDFIVSVAEERGLIQALDMRVLRQACAQVKRWHDLGLITRLAVNMSVKTLSAPDIATAILDVVNEMGVPPAFLELEVTETAAAGAGDALRGNLNTLRRAGIGLAIDDFGTGYSNMMRLRELPFSRLKIDRGFIKNLTCTTEDMRLVKSIITMADALGLRTVAEGVEHLDQLNALCKLGCAEIQGNLFSRPLSAEDMTRLLHQNLRFSDQSQPSRQALDLIQYSLAD